MKEAALCIQDLIRAQGRATPHRTAIECGDCRLSYSELEERTDDLACRLQSLGVRADIPVGIFVERSLDMVVALVGVLKAGGCYLPLDPSYPAERLRFMIADARPPVLLTQQKLQSALPVADQDLTILALDALPFVDHDRSSSPIPGSEVGSSATADLGSLAYVIYTSGSTGKPKGVMITHGNVTSFVAAMDRLLGTEPGVWLAVTSISFDISVLELLWTLARGFTVVIWTGAVQTGVDDKDAGIPEQILRRGVTHFQCTPSLAGSIVLASQAPPALRQLRKFLVGGEALVSTLADRLRQYLTGDLLNMYGPTETTVWSAAHLVCDTRVPIPLGHPISNAEIRIVDESLEEADRGQSGEIVIGGRGVARGYLNRPELTEEKFVRLASSDDSSSRFYRTGDLGRIRADGTIEFLGRMDHQVKLRGHRIELGEIETLLLLHPNVRDCVIRLWDAGPEDQRLVAYMVGDDGQHASPEKLRDYLGSKLPPFMVPATFVWLAGMPLTPNGKIDRKALPAPTETPPVPNNGHAFPLAGVEGAIAKIWRETLRVEHVGLHDNFFDLGGHSLLLMQTQVRLREVLGVEIPVMRLLEHPTVSALRDFLALPPTTQMNEVRKRAQRQQQAFARRRTPALA